MINESPSLDVTPRLKRWVERNFEPGTVEAVLATLRVLRPGAVGSQDVERIQASLVIRTAGDWRRFERMVELANEDWRDALVVADLAQADWREQLDAVL